MEFCTVSQVDITTKRTNVVLIINNKNEKANFKIWRAIRVCEVHFNC